MNRITCSTCEHWKERASADFVRTGYCLVQNYRITTAADYCHQQREQVTPTPTPAERTSLD